MNNCYNLEIASLQYKLCYNHTIGILLRQEKKLLLHIRSVDIQDTLFSRSQFLTVMFCMILFTQWHGEEGETAVC